MAVVTIGLRTTHARASCATLSPRGVATSVDEIEEAFQRKKRRELDQARMAGSGDRQPVQQVVRGAAKIGRNDPCHCGSGKKYKKCHGANA